VTTLLKSALQYARENDHRKKEDLLLELIRLIVPGSLPETTRGVNREARALLWYFLPA
jgi:hypothetical protein